MGFKGFVGEVIGFLLIALALSFASVYVVARIGRMDVKLRRQANEVKALRELVLRRRPDVSQSGPRAPCRVAARLHVIADTPLPIRRTDSGPIPNSEPRHFFTVTDVTEPSPKDAATPAEREPEAAVVDGGAAAATDASADRVPPFSSTSTS